MHRFYQTGPNNRLTMDQNSIEAPESPIFSHGQTSINTLTKNLFLPLTNNWSKGFFFLPKQAQSAPTWVGSPIILTIRNRVGIRRQNNYCASLCDTLSSILIEKGLQVSLSFIFFWCRYVYFLVTVALLVDYWNYFKATHYTYNHAFILIKLYLLFKYSLTAYSFSIRKFLQLSSQTPHKSMLYKNNICFSIHM